ncbi:GNAT family N-acetyltransferase [Heyndrickxia oleronia]|uniref:GNAT family N-acetyltransferase n=1 Tax=Heyndrickxia oleronia TaxID=38875 RepID=A0AAW6T5A9_9BACI|nr:GNAT family N-acetyltransferase [Heyndrickxia oleronia]MDH5164547.1 GNAT family N-acetyltransferase [Heyndrickxia oleronia]
MCKISPTNVFTYKSKDGKIVIVREAKEQDAERILNSASKALINAPYMLTTVDDVKNMRVDSIQKTLKAYLENPNYVQFIAEVDGKLVGSIDFKNGNKEKISHQGAFAMTILPEYRNYGIGRALLKTLINWAKNNSKIEKVCLEVMEDNLGAIKLYKNLGFFEEGRKAKGIKMEDGYQDLILMALFV